MTDAFVRLLAHPTPIVADVVGQPSRTAPGNALFPLAFAHQHPHGVGCRIHGGLISELGRYLDLGLVEQDRDRVEVGADGPQAEPLYL